MAAYLEPTPDSARALFMRGIVGNVVMLNLLRLRDVADYSAHRKLAPLAPISGARAYERYIEHTMPFLTASGGEVLINGEGGEFLIGPQDERWDRALIVRQHRVEAFMALAQDKAYLAGIGHRSAAVEDSRLLPLTAIGR